MGPITWATALDCSILQSMEDLRRKEQELQLGWTLLLQSRSYCCGFMGASLKAIASAARKRQQQPNTDRW